jgi:hypothetical protein
MGGAQNWQEKRLVQERAWSCPCYGAEKGEQRPRRRRAARGACASAPGGRGLVERDSPLDPLLYLLSREGKVEEEEG